MSDDVRIERDAQDGRASTRPRAAARAASEWMRALGGSGLAREQFACKQAPTGKLPQARAPFPPAIRWHCARRRGPPFPFSGIKDPHRVSKKTLGFL